MPKKEQTVNLDDAKNAVKTGWKLLVDELGGVDATASACGVSRSLVSEYGNRNGERFAPAHTILAGERVAGTPHVTSAMARALGYELVLVEVPRAQTELAKVAAELGRDVSALFATIAEALQNPDALTTDVADLMREAGDVYRVTAEILTVLKTLQVRS